MLNVPVVMLLAAAAVLVGVVVVALGNGGEMTFFPADYAPIKLDEVAATDVVLFRPPLGLWGYNTQATDEALNRIADALTERDIEIAALRQQVADLSAEAGASVEAPPARLRDFRGPDRFRPIARDVPPPGAPGDRLQPFARDVPPPGAPGDRLQPFARDVPPPGAAAASQPPPDAESSR